MEPGALLLFECPAYGAALSRPSLNHKQIVQPSPLNGE